MLVYAEWLIHESGIADEILLLSDDEASGASRWNSDSSSVLSGECNRLASRSYDKSATDGLMAMFLLTFE
jgi:hypothetical protein